MQIAKSQALVALTVGKVRATRRKNKFGSSGTENFTAPNVPKITALPIDDETNFVT
jgi:hypothetical protein